MNGLAARISKKFSKYHLLWLALIILLASYLRIYHLGDTIQALTQDEVVNGYDAFSIGHTLRDHHGTLLPLTLGSFGDSASVALTYLTIPFVVLGGLNEFMVRLPIALTGIGSVALIYLLIREVSKNNNMALLGAFILAIAPWNVTLTRWAVPPSVVPFFLFLFLWLLALAVNRSKYYYAVAAGIAAALLTYAYPAAQVLTPFILLSGGLIYMYKRKRDLAIMLGSYALCTAPLFYLILFDTSSNFARLNAVRLTSTGWNLVGDVANRYQGYFSYNFYFGPKANNPIMHVPSIGNFYSFLFVFLIIAAGIIVFNLIRKSSRSSWHKKIAQPEILKLLLFTLICLLLAPVPASFSIDKHHVTRAIFMLPFITLIITASVYFVLSSVRTISLRVAAVTAFVLVSLLAASNYFHVYKTTYPVTVAPYFQYGVREGIRYTVLHQSEYKSIVVDRTINQPYIYYLFYAAYNPHNINYSDMNKGIRKQPFVVDRVGIYKFAPLTKSDIKDADFVESIKGYDQVWFDIYRRGNDELILKNHYQ